MRTLVYPADQGGCGHYRLIWPAKALQAEGRDVHLRGDGDFSAKMLDRPDGTSRVVGLHTLPEADVIVLQRPMQRHLVDCIPHLQAHGIAVVVEVDDNFRDVSPRNIAWKAAHPSTSTERNWQHLMRATQMADLVTVTTPALAQLYGSHGRVEILPNFVPRIYQQLSPVRPDNVQGKMLGWSGSVETHPDDLQVTRGAVGRALRRAGDSWSFHVIGTGVNVCERLELPELTASGWRDLASYEYPRHMAGLDLGIVPLELSAFNEGKSWLKGLEWAALGVPFVASPTQQYQALHAIGAGLLAKSARDWEGKLARLMQHEDERKALAEKARNAVHFLTIEERAGDWEAAWQSARDRRLQIQLSKAVDTLTRRT